MTITLVALGEVAAIQRDGVSPEAITDGTRYLGLEHIESGGRIIGGAPVDAGKLASSKFAFAPTDVLYGKLRPYLAKIALPEFAGVCSTDIVPIRPSGQLDRRYLAYFLRQPEMVALANSRATGANLPRLSPKELARIEIPLPPLEEQKRIAAILDQADALRRLRARALDRLNALGQAIFHEMFEGGTVPVEPLTKVVSDVRIGPFGSLLHKSDYVDGGIPLINPMHIRDGQIFADASFSVSNEKADELERYRIKSGQIILGRRGEMGRCAVVGDEHAGFICGTGSMILVPNGKRMGAQFLSFYLRTPQARKRLEQAASGVTMANLNSSSLDDVPIPVPALELQMAFGERLLANERLIATSAEIATKANTLFASLQHRAFRGEL